MFSIHVLHFEFLCFSSMKGGKIYLKVSRLSLTRFLLLLLHLASDANFHALIALTFSFWATLELMKRMSIYQWSRSNTILRIFLSNFHNKLCSIIHSTAGDIILSFDTRKCQCLEIHKCVGIGITQQKVKVLILSTTGCFAENFNTAIACR